jgi:hypothetical protein
MFQSYQNLNIPSSFIKAKDDHIYYNIEIKRDAVNPRPIPATFIDRRADPIIEIPEEYHLSVLRASIPGEYIPLFIYPNTGPEGSRVVDNTKFSVTLSLGANDYRTFVTFISANVTVPSTSEEYYYQYSFQGFINMINTAFQTAFNNLKAANPGNSATAAPYLIYNNTSYLVSLIIQPQYLNNIRIYMNDRLYSFFESFNVIYGDFGIAVPNGKNIEFVLEQTKNNCYCECQFLDIGTTNTSTTITSAGLFTPALSGAVISGAGIVPGTTVLYVNVNQMTLSNAATATNASIQAKFEQCNLLEIKQDYQTTYLWSNVKSIVLLSNLIPVKEEYTPTISNTVQSSDDFLRILTDFEPPLSSGNEIRSTYTYTPTAEYRRIDLKGTNPINMFDVSVYWKDSDGILHNIFVPAFGNGMSIKFLFEKKAKPIFKI